MDFGFADQTVRERPDPVAIAAADEGWITMHGPKIEMRRRKGEENAALALAAMGVTPTGMPLPVQPAVAKACGGGTEQLPDEEAPALVPMACGGGKEQLSDAEAARV